MTKGILESLEHQCEFAEDQALRLYRGTQSRIDRTHMNVCILEPERFVKEVFYPNGDEPVSFG